MRKIALIILTFCMAVGTVAAQDDDGMGLYVGAEIGILDLSEAADMTDIRPYVGYEASFGDIDVNAELGVNILTHDEGSPTLDINVGGTYNISISDASKLAFNFGVWAYFPFDDEKYGFSLVSPYGYDELTMLMGNKFNMHLNLGAKFTQTLDIGDLYFGIDVPFLLIHDTADAFDMALLNFTTGLDMESGLGFGLKFYGWIGNKDFIDEFALLLDIFASYTSGPLFFGVTVGIPMVEDGIKYVGLAITPEFSCTLDMGLKLYAELPISGIGADEGDSILGLTVGAKFSF